MKKIVSVIIICCMLMPTMLQINVFAYTDVKITYNGQVVDSFAGVDAIYATLSSYSNVDTNTTYSCAAFLKKFCSKLWGVTIYNINMVQAAPTVTKAGHSVSLRTVSTPRPGDIMQTKNYSHVAVVKSVSGSNVTLIEQNVSHNSGGYRYAHKDRVISVSSAYFYRMIIDGKEAAVPGQSIVPPKSIPQISSIKGNGSNVTVSWNAVSGAEKYTVDFWNPNGSHNYFSTTETSITQSLPDAQYGIRICAENSAGTSGFSGFHYFWVSQSEVPAVPQITDVDVSGISVTVKWEFTDKTNLYTVDFWNAETGVHNYYQTGDTTITQTLPSAQYGIRICSENTAGTSGFSGFYYVYVGEYPISFDANGGELEKTKARIKYDSINGTRGEDQLVIYNNSGTSTGTNMYGIEVLINKSNQVIDIINRVGSATVPTNGFVLSAHREKHYWLEENVVIGDYVNFHPDTQEVWIWSQNGWLTWTKGAEIGKEYGKLPIPLNREGYTFDGWYTSATGGEKVTETTIVVAAGEHTLYAHWPPIEAHTSTTINNNLFTIKCTNIENGNRVILALYKDKKFIKLYEDIYQGEDIPFTVTEDYDEAKVMVWKDLSTLKPITDVEIVK